MQINRLTISRAKVYLRCDCPGRSCCMIGNVSVSTVFLEMQLPGLADPVIVFDAAGEIL